jgi:hypothetical protein
MSDQPDGRFLSKIGMPGWKKPVLFVLLFFVTWVIRVFIYKYVDLGIESLALATVSSVLWKTVVWIIFPVLYIVFVDKKNPLEYLKLSGNAKKAVIWSLVAIAVGIVWQFTLLVLKLDSTFTDLHGVFVAIWIAGTCEEVLFRGFLLSKFGEFMSFTKAMLATSLLFVFVHIPSWLIFMGYSPRDVLFNGLYVFFISLIFSMLVKVSNSLYPSIVFHSIADIIAF